MSDIRKKATTTNYNMLSPTKNVKSLEHAANAHPKWLKIVIGPWYKEPCITQ